MALRSRITLASVAAVAITFLLAPAQTLAQSAYCGTVTVGTCAGGATAAGSGSIWARGDGFTCLWECEAPDSTLHQVQFWRRRDPVPAAERDDCPSPRGQSV